MINMFFKQLSYRIVFAKYSPFSNLENVRVENEKCELKKVKEEHSLKASLIV